MRKLNQIIFSISASAFDNLTRPDFASRPDNFCSEIDLPAGSVCDDGSNDAGPGHNCEREGSGDQPSPRLLTNGQDFLHHYFCPRHTESNRTEVISSDISYGTQERDQVKLFFLAIIH